MSVKGINRVSRSAGFFVLFGGIMLVLSACSEEQAKVEEIVRPVKVVEINGENDQRTVIYPGAVQARTEVNLGFRVGGKIVERKVDIGQRVNPGDVLARIDRSDLDLAVKSARASVVSAKAQLDTTAVNATRAEQLFTKGVGAKAIWDQRKLEHDQSISAYEAAQSSLAQAENQVAYAELQSDVSGIVTGVPGSAGQVVAAGTPVVTVARDGEKEIAIAVPEQDIRHFAVGKTVAAQFWATDGLVVKAVVREVAGSADAASRTYAVRLSIPENDGVLLGMTALVQVPIDSDTPSITIPVASLSQKDGKTVVWLVDREKGTVLSRDVTVTGFADEGARIGNGLSRGDIVVSAGTQFMSEGLKVKLPAAATQVSKL